MMPLSQTPWPSLEVSKRMLDDHMAETLWFYYIIIPFLLEFKGH